MSLGKDITLLNVYNCVYVGLNFYSSDFTNLIISGSFLNEEIVKKTKIHSSPLFLPDFLFKCRGG